MNKKISEIVKAFNSSANEAIEQSVIRFKISEPYSTALGGTLLLRGIPTSILLVNILINVLRSFIPILFGKRDPVMKTECVVKVLFCLVIRSINDRTHTTNIPEQFLPKNIGKRTPIKLPAATVKSREKIGLKKATLKCNELQRTINSAITDLECGIDFCNESLMGECMIQLMQKYPPTSYTIYSTSNAVQLKIKYFLLTTNSEGGINL